jgi:chromosome segregation ATPase
VNTLNEDVFYVDGEQFYNLKYTHKELIDLFKKIEDNEVLTKEQYDKLINEIGLDNISTFDLNYYNLKNLPYIPVRVGDLFNDVGYDVKARVDNEFELLRADLKNEIERIDSIKAELENIDIEELLKQIGIAQSQADYLSSDIRNLNGVVFSFERSIELIQDKTAEVVNEFEALKNMQERDEYRLDNIHKFLTTHTEDIQFLLRFYETERDRLTNTIKDLIELQKAVDLLEEYHGIMNNVDLRISNIEAFIKLLNPDEVDLENLLLLENSIKNLQERDKEYQLFHENISQQMNELISKLQNDLDVINNNISLIQETVNENVTALSNHDNQLIDHNERLENLNSKLGTVITSVYKNTSDIKDLKDKDSETQTELGLITSDIQSLIEEDSEHREQLKNINVEITSLHNNLSESNKKIQNNLSEIESLKERLGNDESWHEKTEQQLINIQNDISNNSNKIEEIDDSLKNVNDTLVDVEDDLKRMDAEILSINTNLENHHEENAERIKKVDEAVETLNSRMGASEANFLTLQSRTSIIEDDMQTLATKEALNSINMQMHINEQGYVVVELFIEGNVVSSIIIPYNVKFEDQIAKTDSARTDYSKTI